MTSDTVHDSDGKRAITIRFSICGNVLGSVNLSHRPTRQRDVIMYVHLVAAPSVAVPPRRNDLNCRPTVLSFDATCIYGFANVHYNNNNNNNNKTNFYSAVVS